MLYEFAKQDGSVVDVEYQIGTAPAIGETCVVDGELLTRLPSVPDLGPGLRRDECFESITAPTKANAELWGLPPPPDGYSDDGLPRIRSRRGAHEYAKRCEREDGRMEFHG